MKSGLKILKDNFGDLVKALNALPIHDVLVGIPEENADRKQGQGPITNAALGYIHENGAPEANIPARPFLMPGIRSAEPKVAKYMMQAGKAALDGEEERIDRILHAAGMVASNSVKDTINAGVPPALKEGTIAARLRRGRTGNVPLIDTGQLRNSITYVVRKKESK
jgi:phage gpG-like protein